MSEQQMRRIASSLPLTLRAAFLICWAVAGRMGDVMQLQRQDVNSSWRDNEQGLVVLSVHFRRGKVVPITGPYTVETVLPFADAEIVHRVLRSTEQKFLFHARNKAERLENQAEIRRHMRRACSTLELRAIRRGALQHMSERGATMEELLYFSKHVDVGMLRRYLQFGKKAHVENQVGRRVAQLLWRSD